MKKNESSTGKKDTMSQDKSSRGTQSQWENKGKKSSDSAQPKGSRSGSDTQGSKGTK
jgi:hypothetical protein